MQRYFAIVIIVAVTITIGVAAVAWIIANQNINTYVEALRVRYTSIYYNESDNSWWVKFTVFNEGSKPVEIIRVEVKGSELLNLEPPRIIQPGEEVEVVVKLTKTYIKNTAYSVVIHTKNGALYPVITKAS